MAKFIRRVGCQRFFVSNNFILILTLILNFILYSGSLMTRQLRRKLLKLTVISINWLIFLQMCDYLILYPSRNIEFYPIIPTKMKLYPFTPKKCWQSVVIAPGPLSSSDPFWTVSFNMKTCHMSCHMSCFYTWGIRSQFHMAFSTWTRQDGWDPPPPTCILIEKMMSHQMTHIFLELLHLFQVFIRPLPEGGPF